MNDDRSRIEILESDGWTKQFIASEPRLSEAVEMYRETGFEIHLEPLPKESECKKRADEDGGRECRICFEGAEDHYRIIFTRPNKGAKGATESKDDLF